MEWLGRVVALLVAFAAWRIARLRPYHRAMATWLAVVAAADVARWALSITLLAVSGPYTGCHRVAFHAEQAMMLAEPFGLVAVALMATTRRNVTHVVGAYLAVVAVLVTTYPALRGAALGWVYFGVEVAAAGVVACGAVAWWRARRWPTMTEILVAVYAAMRAALVLVGPFAAHAGPFAEWWRGDGAQLACVLLSLALHAAWWRVISPRGLRA